MLPKSAAHRIDVDLAPGFIWIYALCEPDLTVRYVGKARVPGNRFAQHLRGDGNQAKSSWIRSLLAAGTPPRMVLLEKVAETEWPRAERRWTFRFKRHAELFNLVNVGARDAAPSATPGWPDGLDAFSEADADLAIEALSSEPILEAVDRSRMESRAIIVASLRYAMHKTRASVDIAARWLGCSRTTLQHWLTGESPVSVESIFAAPRLSTHFLRCMAVLECDPEMAFRVFWSWAPCNRRAA